MFHALIYTRSSSSSSSSSWPHPPPFNDGRFNEDKALPRKIHDRFPYISTSLLLLPLPFRVFRVPPSSGSRNEILRYRAACRWDGDKYRRRVDEEGKKERKRGREKAAAFRLMLLSPSLALSLSVATDGSKASRDSAAYWWPDIPYASTRSKEDVSRGS